jgi:hypothetical protein
MRIILPYNKLDYDYFYPVHEYSLNLFYNTEFEKDAITSQCKSMVSFGTLNRIVADNNANKEHISSLIKSHSTYLKSLSTSQFEVKILSLWTNPEINTAIKYILRNRIIDYTQTPRDLVYTLIYLYCILDLNNADIYMKSEELIQDINQIEEGQQLNEHIQSMFYDVMNGFVQPITKTILNAPIVNVPFTCFRSCNGSIVKQYTELKPNDFVVEHGFTTVTWHPLAAGLLDTISDSITLMPIYLPKNTRILSIYTVSATPIKRELILPPGTVLMKTNSGVFVVIGIQKEFASLGSNENNDMQTYTNTIMNDTLCSSENNRNTFTQPSLTIQTTLTSPNNNSTYNNHDNDDYDDDNQSQTQTEMETQTQSQTQTLHKFDVPLQFPFSPPPPLAPPSAEPAGFGAAGLSAFPNTRTKKYENPNGLFTYFTPEGMSLNTHTIDNVIVSLKYKDLCKKYKIKTYEENEQGNKCTFFKQK